MVKSPMEYFQEQDFSTQAAPSGEMTAAERAFLKKYLGIDDPSLLQGIAPVEGVPVAGMALNAVRQAALRTGEPDSQASLSAEISVGADHSDDAHTEATSANDRPTPSISWPIAESTAAEPTSAASATDAYSAKDAQTAFGLVTDELVRTAVDAMLPTLEIVTLVGFYISGDVFVVPIDSVMEVIRYEEPYKLPMSPSFMSGVVNLRGRILPVMRLTDMLVVQNGETPPVSSTSLIIICEAHGLQIGLLVDKLHTMFKAKQNDITWNAEAHLGASAELLSGLLETGEKLLGIISVERLVDKLLSE